MNDYGRKKPKKLKCKNPEQYLDTMRKSLNSNYNSHIFPNWRSHPSLKGN